MKKFTSFDGEEITYKTWPVEKPLALLLVIHGMAEHILRYEELARHLNAHGIAVAGCDSRGHGRTGEATHTLGHFRRGEWCGVVEDVTVLRDLLWANHSDLPVFLLGHSMGSFMARYAIRCHPELFDGAIIMGTGAANRRLALSIADGLLRPMTPTRQSLFVHRLVFGTYNRHFPERRTPMDWLSNLPEEVDRYIADPYCGFVPTIGYYREFFSGLKALAEAEKHLPLAPSLPLLIVSGDQDPVGHEKTYVEAYARHLADEGMADVTLILYEGQRHEILHDEKRQQVMEDITHWILQRGRLHLA